MRRSAPRTVAAFSSSAQLTCSPGVWASNGSPGPKFAAGIPWAHIDATSVQPSFARAGAPVAATSPASSGWSSAGGAPAAASTSSQRSPGPRCPPSSSLIDASADSTVRSGANRWLSTIDASSGTTLPETPPPVVGHRRQHRRQTVDRVPSGPRAGGVRPFAVQADADPQRPLAPCFDHAAGGLPEDGDVGLQPLGPLLPEAEEAVVALLHLLALVEAPRHVHGRFRDGAGEMEEDGQTALHVGGTHAVEGGVDDAGLIVAADRRDGVEVADHQYAAVPLQIGSGHHIVRDPLDREPRAECQRRLHGIGHRSLVVADRRDGDQGGGQSEQATRGLLGHVDTPCARRMSFNCALSCRCPSVRRLITRTQGRKNSPPGNARRREAWTATHHAGTCPRLSSSPVSVSITGMEGFKMVPSPTTAPRPTRAPWVIMHRLPII